MKTNRIRTLRKMFALIAVMATLLTMLVLPASAKTANGFRYFLSEVYEDDCKPYAVITGKIGTISGTLTIPEKIKGYQVLYIAEGAFSGRTGITKVVLPDSLWNVSAFAFSDCTGLKTLVIGDTMVDRGAFSGCTALKKVVITAYKSFHPEWSWSEAENEPLFAAKQEWTHYTKKYDVEETSLKTRTGAKLTLTANRDLGKGESYRWYCADGYAFYPDEDLWSDCTEKTIRGEVYGSEDQTVVCEIVDKNGNVVWAEEFYIQSRESLKDCAKYFVRNTYLYSVTEYTVNHFRWKAMDLLDKMGIDIYGD